MKSIDSVAPKILHGGTKRSLTEIRIGISKGVSQNNNVARIIFGESIIEKLKWQKGNNIEVLFDNTHLALFKKNKARYSLQKMKGANVKNPTWRMTISLFNGMPHAKLTTPIRSVKVDWNYHEDGLLITLPTKQKRA